MGTIKDNEKVWMVATDNTMFINYIITKLM